MCEYTTWRGWPCCSCLATWLPVFEELAQARGELAGKVKILQLRGDNPNSADTHSQGGVFDLGYYTDPEASDYVWIARQMGADATWYRDWDGNHHVHGVLTGCPRNDPAAYQIDAVRDGYNGLGTGGRGGPDDGPKPLSGRTWQQGIEWAEDQMTISDDDAKKIADRVWATLLQYTVDGQPAEASAEAHLTNANIRARDLQINGPAKTWQYKLENPITHDMWSSGSYLTTSATAADEVRDDVNALADCLPVGLTGASWRAVQSVVLGLAVLGLVAVAIVAMVLRG